MFYTYYEKINLFFFLLLIKVPKHCPIWNPIVLGIIRTKIDCWQPEDQWLKVNLSYIVKFEAIMSYMRSCTERLPESLYPSLCTKSKSRWVKDFKWNLRHKKLLGENIGSVLHCIGIGKDFLIITPFVQELRTTTDTWDFIKLKGFYIAGETISWWRGSWCNGKESLPVIIWHKAYTQIIQLNSGIHKGHRGPDQKKKNSGKFRLHMHSIANYKKSKRNAGP